jgi:hypothetical protein
MLAFLAVENEKAPTLVREDRGRAAVIRRFVVDYACTRRRPSVSPDGKAVVIDIDMCVRVRTMCGSRCW